MATLTLTKEDPCWLVLDGASPKLVETIKAGVRPVTRRRFNWDSNKWEVHYQWINAVVTWARGLNHVVDYRTLPDQWQILAAGGGVPNTKLEFSSDPYSILFLKSDAPPQVIKAVYKALAAMYHPDSPTGDKEKFIKLDAAYNEILSSKTRQ